MKHMHYRLKLAAITFLVIAALIAAGYALWSYLKTQNIPVLQPQGSIGQNELNLLIFAAILSLVVIIPVFSIAIFIVFKYNAHNKNAKYSPDWDNNRTIEFIWWGIPIFLILVIATVTWISTHALDPYKPLDPTKPAIKIQVIALDWKWLFIYPEQDIATVNYVKFPIDTQIDFAITSDAPMNSFWIPQLGGQMYAMQGMVTHQHLDATTVGDFAGSSANISGPGFAGMKFVASSLTANDFTAWVNSIKSGQHPTLTKTSYASLAKPSKNNPTASYGAVDNHLFDTIVNKYMGHVHSHHEQAAQSTDSDQEHTNAHQSMSMEMK